MKKRMLFIIYLIIIIFTVIAQVSNELITWLSPDHLSTWDERMNYTLFPIILNFGILYLLKRIKVNIYFFSLLFIINIIFFSYYFYCQFIWDVGKWLLF